MARVHPAPPQTDVFHFYFGLTLVPKSLQFPLLRAMRKKSVMHFLGSDIRGKPPAELAWAQKADARSSAPTTRSAGCPDAEVVPPGIDLRDYTPAPPTDRERPVVLHAPSSRRRKGTEHVIAACAELPVDLEIVEGLHHDEARRRYEHADIVVDQLNAGWYGLFAIEAMALGKPVVTFLHEEAVARTEQPSGPRADRLRHGRDARRAPPAPGRGRHDRRRVGPRAARTSSRSTTSTGSPTACSTSTLACSMALGSQVKRLGSTPPSTGSAGSSPGSSRSSSSRSTRTTSARRASARSRPSSPSRPCS